MTALSRSAVYALMAKSRFPKPIRIGSRAVRWVEQEVLDFIASCPLDRLALEHGLPGVLRTDNALECCGRAMLTWAHARGVTLRLIEPGTPNQHASVESFNGRFRDECLNEHWFTSLAHAQALIEAWRREYNEERPKKWLGGLTPAHYARQLMANGSTVIVGL